MADIGTQGTALPNVTSKSGAPSGLQVAGTSLQAFGLLMSAQETSRGLRLNAREILREGRLNAVRMREQGERVQSAQRTAFSKGGVQLTGTPLEVLAETAAITEQNALEITRSAERNAREARRAARRARRAGVLSAVGTVVGGVIGATVGGTTGAAAGAVLGQQIGTGLGGGR